METRLPPLNLTWIARLWRGFTGNPPGRSPEGHPRTGSLAARLASLSSSEEVAHQLLEILVAESRAPRGMLLLHRPAPGGWTQVGESPTGWHDPVDLPLGTPEQDLGLVRLEAPIPPGDARLRVALWTGALFLDLALLGEDEGAAETHRREQYRAREVQGRMARNVSAALTEGLDETRSWLVSLRQGLSRLGTAERTHELESLHERLANLERKVLENLETIRAGTGPLQPLSGSDGTRYDDHQEES